MNFNVESRTILRVKHGSQAYGLATPTSDLDVKGICIEPLEYHFGFAKNFEQYIQEASKGHAQDLVIYSLKKFCKLASESNPNIIEVLYGNDEDVLFCNEFGAELRAFRDNFLSLKARYTFAGFAHSQLKRIKTHRNWLLNPPKEPPARKDFGLPETLGVSKSELGAFEKLLDDGAVAALSNEALALFSRERAWKNMQTQWSQYQNWKATRNPERAEMEARYGLDCYSHDTEFLTDNGWKHFDSVLPEDKLATVRIENGRKDIPAGTLEYQSPAHKFDGQYNGPLYKLVAYHVDISVTANHQMLIKERSRRLETVSDQLSLVSASHLADSFDIMIAPNPQLRPWKLPPEVQESTLPATALMRLMGWYLSDGSMTFQKSGLPKAITISQKTGNRLCQGMNKFSKKYPNCSLYKYARKPTSIRPYSIEEQILNVRIREVLDLFYRDCGHGSFSKRIPRWVFGLSSSLLSVLFHEMVKGDGTIRQHKTVNDSIIYYTVCKGLADDVQELAVLCGWETSIFGPYQNNTSIGQCLMYQVHVRTTAKQYKTLIRHSNVRTEQVSNHRVVCFSVPNGTLITRRNGSVAVQGNCKHASHLIRLLRMCHEIMLTGKVIVRRPDREELLDIKQGARNYESIVAEAEELEAKCEELYKTSKVLPKSPDINKIDAFVVDLTDRYVRKYG